MLLVSAGHLAVWAGLYVGACVALVPLLLGSTPRAADVLTAAVLAASVYLADRVKLHDRLRNPADAEAHPDRERFMEAHTTLLRGAVWALIVVAAVLAFSMHPLAVALVPLAHLGVLAYASAPRRVRPKDRLGLKNGMVAVSIVGLAAAFTWLTGWPEGVPAASSVIVLAALLIVVAVDAMLCDLEDAAADAAHGTRTVPSVFGPGATWLVALLGMSAAAAMLAIAALRGLLPPRAALVFGGLLVATTLLLFFVPKGHLRDVVDARLPAIASIVLLVS